MPVYAINHRYSGKPIALVEADSLSLALERTVECGVGLLYADLKAIQTPRANLGGGDFRGADLSHASLALALLHGANLRAATLVRTSLQAAVLWRADLRQADLSEADLRNANLQQALLVGADLRGALLTGARLDRAILDWRYSPVPLELLRQADCGNATACASGLLAELAFHDDAKPFAWLRVLLQHASEGGADWAFGVLARHIHPDDGAPEVLRRLAADAPAESGAIPVSRSPVSSSRRVLESSPHFWTRRRTKQPKQIGPF
jgi:hypothetical protein